MKKMSKRLLSLALALVLSVMCLAGCGGKTDEPKTDTPAQTDTPAATPDANTPSEPAPDASGEKILKLATPIEGAADKTVYPWHNPSGPATAAMYRSLLLADANLTDVTPDLATDYSVSPDGLTYTFTIKEGVKWSDGEDLTAEDVAFSI